MLIPLLVTVQFAPMAPLARVALSYALLRYPVTGRYPVTSGIETVRLALRPLGKFVEATFPLLVSRSCWPDRPFGPTMEEPAEAFATDWPQTKPNVSTNICVTERMDEQLPNDATLALAPLR